MHTLRELSGETPEHYSNEPGFVGCCVFGNPAAGLWFSFDSREHAAAFRLKREQVNLGYPLTILGGDVIEFREVAPRQQQSHRESIRSF